METFEVPTDRGPARVHVHGREAPRALLVLGHGAGGGVDAPDLVRVRDVALAEGFRVALVEQPYRVAGRRGPAPARQLDAAWSAVVAALREGAPTLPIVTGGRSSGARVACRTATAVGAAAVLCLAFPLTPPQGRGAAERPSRLPELERVTTPVLIVQGARDPFGLPPPGPSRTVVEVVGDHALKADLDAVAAAVRPWLAEVVGNGSAGTPGSRPHAPRA